MAKDTSKQGAPERDLDREVVQTLLDTGAVDFDAIGAALAKYGPRAALIRDDEEWENFCLTMKVFIHVYRLPTILGPFGLEDSARLRETIGRELHDS